MTALKPGQVTMQVITTPDVRRGLKVLAAQHDRTVQEEANLALQAWLDQQRPAAPRRRE